jgi:hypothetical protein
VSSGFFLHFTLCLLAEESKSGSDAKQEKGPCRLILELEVLPVFTHQVNLTHILTESFISYDMMMMRRLFLDERSRVLSFPPHSNNY